MPKEDSFDEHLVAFKNEQDLQAFSQEVGEAPERPGRLSSFEEAQRQQQLLTASLEMQRRQIEEVNSII